MTPAELREQLERDRQELFNLRFQATGQQLDNPRRLRMLRKNIARILTILGERQTG
jgi:large subunit ribosomal protein L29